MNSEGCLVISMIEDHAVIRHNLIRYLELQKNYEVGLVSVSAEDYFKDLTHKDISTTDILLLDIGLPGMSGLDAIPLILEKQKNINIIIITTYEEEKYILKAMCLGAVAYISKKTPLKKIVEAINIVNSGGSYMSPLIARDIFNYIIRSNQKKKSLVLTDRQHEVLEFLVEGLSYTEIGKKLFISPETVRTHIKKLYKALHVNNKVDAIKKYLDSVS